MFQQKEGVGAKCLIISCQNPTLNRASVSASSIIESVGQVKKCVDNIIPSVNYLIPPCVLELADSSSLGSNEQHTR